MWTRWGYLSYHRKNKILFFIASLEDSAGNGRINLYNVSEEGLKLIANFELGESVIKRDGLGEFDAEGNLVGIYPYYVFKREEGKGYISDGGITLGYGFYISKGAYDKGGLKKELIDTYAPNAPLIPSYIPQNGASYRVPGSFSVPMDKVYELFSDNIYEAECSVSVFLYLNNIEL